MITLYCSLVFSFPGLLPISLFWVTGLRWMPQKLLSFSVQLYWALAGGYLPLRFSFFLCRAVYLHTSNGIKPGRNTKNKIPIHTFTKGETVTRFGQTDFGRQFFASPGFCSVHRHLLQLHSRLLRQLQQIPGLLKSVL